MASFFEGFITLLVAVLAGVMLNDAILWRRMQREHEAMMQEMLAASQQRWEAMTNCILSLCEVYPGAEDEVPILSDDED
ncbi:MAG: hypothetical protein ACXWP0_00140 [Ktedonobacterales bacterium]